MMLPCVHRLEKKDQITLCRRTRRGTKLRDAFDVYGCALFVRCLPGLNRWEEQHKGAEDQIYKLCRKCDQRLPPAQ